MFKAIYQAVLDGNAPGCVAGVTAALQAGSDPAAILNEGMVAAMAHTSMRRMLPPLQDLPKHASSQVDSTAHWGRYE